MIQKILRVMSLSQLVFIEGIRRYALVGLMIFALAAQVSSLFFLDFIPRDIGRATNDFIFSIIWFAGMIFLFFHTVHVVAWDDGRRVIHTLLARPISRHEYVLGVFCGLAGLLLLLNVLLGIIGWSVLLWIRQLTPEVYFGHLSLPTYLLASLGLYCIEMMILAAIILFSGLVRGHFPVLLISLSYYFICTGLPVVRQGLTAEARNASQSLQIVLRFLSAVFPDFGRFDFKSFVTSSSLSLLAFDYFLIFGTSVLYIMLLLWLSALLYRSRDLQ